MLSTTTLSSLIFYYYFRQYYYSLCVLNYPWYYDARDADAYFRALEQSVPEIHTVPEGHKISFYLYVVTTVQPVQIRWKVYFENKFITIYH